MYKLGVLGQVRTSGKVKIIHLETNWTLREPRFSEFLTGLNKLGSLNKLGCLGALNALNKLGSLRQSRYSKPGFKSGVGVQIKILKDKLRI